jgi:hypothetical protein
MRYAATKEMLAGSNEEKPMIVELTLGLIGVQRAREASRSALPDAPVVRERIPWTAAARIRTAGTLHRLADRVGPCPAHGSLRQA